MNLVVTFQLLVLLTLANGTPVIAKRILGDWHARPLDGGVILPDGAPLLGKSKTIRGIVLAVLMTAAGAQVMGLGWRIGSVVGAMAMLGDVFSSFVKRRLKLAPSSPAIGLDQIPESLLPLLACKASLALRPVEILAMSRFF